VFGAGRVPRGGIRVLPARYSFAELRAWDDQAVSLLQIPGVVSSGIDHAANALRVGVQDLRLESEVRRALQDLGIPEEAVVIEERAGPLVFDGLQDRERPVEGGLNVDNNNCTLGFNALRAGVEGFVTASHCSTLQAVLDWHTFFQMDPVLLADKLGSETVDPPWFGSATDARCPVGAQCRLSDSDFSPYDPGVQFQRGKIEKTVGGPDPIPANFNIAGSFRITGTGVALQGQTVNKVGRSTGWTQGTVTAVCVHEPLNPPSPTQFLLCQTEANYNSAGGDSGSPVFMIEGSTDNVTLVGIHWGMWLPAGPRVFSPFGQVAGATELGPLTVTAPPVGGIAELPDVAQAAASQPASSDPPYAPLAAGVAAALLAGSAGAWYARRRWLR